MISDTQKLPKPVSKERGGSVVVDERGRNVWGWTDEQGNSTSIVLKRLENSALELEPTRNAERLTLEDAAPRPRPSAAKAVAKPAKQKGSERCGNASITLTADLDYDAGGGFDPYNNR